MESTPKSMTNYLAENATIFSPEISADISFEQLWDSDIWQKAAAVSLEIDQNDGPVPLLDTQVKICHSDKEVFFLITCQEPQIDEMILDVTEDYDPAFFRDWYTDPSARGDDRLEIIIEPIHMHSGLHKLAVNANGAFYFSTWMNSRHCYDVRDWWTHLPERGPDWRRIQKIPHKVKAEKGDKSWTVLLGISRDSFEHSLARNTRCWGINFIRVRKTPSCYCVSSWTDARIGLPMTENPRRCGDLIFSSKREISIVNFDPGEIVWGENVAEFVLENYSDKETEIKIELKLLTNVYVNDPHIISEQGSNTAYRLKPSGRTTVRVPYVIASTSEPTHILCIFKNAKNNEVIFHSGYDLGACVVNPNYGKMQKTDDPSPDDPDFYTRKRNYLTSRLPKFIRRTTLQGAESDFVLEAEDKSVSFNLMKPQILKDIAQYIYSLYDNDIDRVLGAAYFVSQREVMAYAGGPSFTAMQLSPTSMLRFGLGMCGLIAMAGVGIIRNMISDKTGTYFRAYPLDIYTHSISVAEIDGRLVVVDPTNFAKFFYLDDNKTLATPEDIMNNPDILRRAGFQGPNKFVDPPFRYGNLPYGVFPRYASET